MKRNDISALHNQSVTELNGKLAELEKQLVDARLKIQLGQMKNVKMAKMIRQDIARIKTVITEKTLQVAE